MWGTPGHRASPQSLGENLPETHFQTHEGQEVF